MMDADKEHYMVGEHHGPALFSDAFWEQNRRKKKKIKVGQFCRGNPKKIRKVRIFLC